MCSTTKADVVWLGLQNGKEYFLQHGQRLHRHEVKSLNPYHMVDLPIQNVPSKASEYGGLPVTKIYKLKFLGKHKA